MGSARRSTCSGTFQGQKVSRTSPFVTLDTSFRRTRVLSWPRRSSDSSAEARGASIRLRKRFHATCDALVPRDPITQRSDQSRRRLPGHFLELFDEVSLIG